MDLPSDFNSSSSNSNSNSNRIYSSSESIATQKGFQAFHPFSKFK